MAVESELSSNANEDASWKQRVQHFTWAWFTLPLSTAGISVLLSATPHRFHGLEIIGKIFFILSLVFFVIVVLVIAARFVMFPPMLMCSLTHPHEALFFPTAILAVGTLIGCAWAYGASSCGPWLAVAIEVLYWLYTGIAFTASILQYFYLFSTPLHKLTVQTMTPAWILPVFPSLFGGVLAGLLASGQDSSSSAAIIISGVTLTGLGWTVAILMYAVWIQRLMTSGLPPPNLRPGMFIAAGPPAFTGLALINLASALPNLKHYGYFAINEDAINVLRAVADFTAIFLWLFGTWFFFITFIALVSGWHEMSFHLVWWAIVFPNVALALATGRIGQRLQSQGIMWIASVMAIGLVAAWFFVVAFNFRAVVKREIMMPGKDEDKECHPAVLDRL